MNVSSRKFSKTGFFLVSLIIILFSFAFSGCNLQLKTKNITEQSENSIFDIETNHSEENSSGNNQENENNQNSNENQPHEEEDQNSSKESYEVLLLQFVGSDDVIRLKNGDSIFVNLSDEQVDVEFLEIQTNSDSFFFEELFVSVENGVTETTLFHVKTFSFETKGEFEISVSVAEICIKFLLVVQ